MQIFPLKDLSGKYCLSPFVAVHINDRGFVNMCLCPEWQPTIVGNILEQSLEEILSSDLVVKIRNSIIQGTYQYCNEKQCPLLINGALNTIDNIPDNIRPLLQDPTKYVIPYEIIINGDRTCNLSCPSCRTSVIKVSKDAKEKQQKIVNTLYNNLFSKPSNLPLHLIPGASGEIFSSDMMLSLLEKLNLHDFPKLKISLHTNGLLSLKNWHRIEHLEPAIKSVTVSIDAATKSTYEVVRRGGNWGELLVNLEFLKSKKLSLGFDFNSRLIFQTRNYRESVSFYNLSKSYNIDRVEFSRISNWYTFSPDDFIKHDVLNIENPEYNKAKEIVAQIKQLENIWLEGDFG